jgi:hypothetical protein
MRRKQLLRGSVLRFGLALAATLAFAQCQCGKDVPCGMPGSTDTSCFCSAGMTACTSPGGSLECVDLASDAQNCGVCGTVCGPSEACSNGGCIAVPTDGSTDAAIMDASQDVADAFADIGDAGDNGDATLHDSSADADADATPDALDAGPCNSQASCIAAGFPADYVCCKLEAGPTCQAPSDGSPECLGGSFCGQANGITQLCQTAHECDPSCSVDGGGCNCSGCISGACIPF